MLKDKKILIFVSGSIAIYKILMLIRALRKEGALVRIVATQSALKFIMPLSFETLSNTPLLYDSNECWASTPHTDSINTLESHIQRDSNPPQNHIGYAKWADIALFAPLTANSLNKLANGIADNIYLATALALPNIPKLLAPSANTLMLENPITQKNIEILKNSGYEIINPALGMLACGDVGNGAMADIETMLFALRKANFNNPYWRDQYVIVTGGGSIEEIDSVRCISNHSSGMQASNLALALYYLGAKVIFISSKSPIILPPSIKHIQVKSSKDYENALNHTIESINENEKIYLFMAAAISDYIPHKREGKLKKKDLGDTMTLELHENKDILATLKAKNLVKIGFKAECDKENAKQNAKNALIKKQCSMMCLNIISESNMSFGAIHNELYLITKDSEKYIQGTKLEVSFEICAYLQILGV